MKMKTIFLGLNELNFNYIKEYANQGFLPNFKKLFEKYDIVETLSEKKYEELEPWIQWVTISTGMEYAEHQVFRLGDIKKRNDLLQIYEKVENKGYSVAAISPFNADNRLKNPCFFVSDPWTNTEQSGTTLLKALGEAVSQAVNDNASGKLSFKSVMALMLGLIKYPRFSSYPEYFKRIIEIKKKGTKAIILDKLLGDVFISEWKRTNPDFSHLFLNTGAHIQHHYMFNSRAYKGSLKNPDWYCPQTEDPLKEVLIEYDKIVGRLLKLPVRLILATGLHQVPHSHLTYYWRLKNHVNFLKKINITFQKNVEPRMSRDFLIDFHSTADALRAEVMLNSYKSSLDDEVIFQVDNRGDSLFVELVYSNEITKNFSIVGDETISNFENEIAFVAIKNGEHNTLGYFLDTGSKPVEKRIPLKQVHFEIMNIFS